MSIFNRCRAATLGVALVGSSVAFGQVLVVDEDFEGAVNPVFSGGSVESQNGLGSFWGPFGVNQPGPANVPMGVSLAVDTDAGRAYQVVFDLFVIGTWDGNTGKGFSRDLFEINAGDAGIYSGTFNFKRGRSGYVEADGSGKLNAAGKRRYLLYRDLSANFVAQGGTTELEFVATTTGRDEGFAIDNFRLIAAEAVPADIETAFRELVRLGFDRDLVD